MPHAPKLIAAAGALGLMALPGLANAQLATTDSQYSVAKTAERLQNVVEGAGATVVAVHDHAGAAADIGEDLPPMKLVIFGNPQVGTPLMQESASVGVDLPVRVLVRETAEGDVELAYTDPEALAERHDIPTDHPSIQKMAGALDKLTTAAGQGD